MTKKQVDLFGNVIPYEKVDQEIKQIKRKKIETIITEKLLEPILKIVLQERHFLTWPVDILISKIAGIISLIKDKVEVSITQIFESFISSLKDLKQYQQYESSRELFMKIFRNFEDLYIFCLNDNSNSLPQFLRIFNLMQIFMELIWSVEADTGNACERAMSSLDKEELKIFYKEEENRLISEIDIKIVNDRFRIFSRGDEKRYDVPLYLERFYLQSKYFPSQNSYLYRKQETIKKLPEFFARILLEDEDRIKFDHRDQFDVIRSINLSRLRLTSLPKEIGLISSIKELYLGFNRLKTLPESLRKLKSLEKLNLKGNPIESFPEAIHILIARGVQIQFPEDAQLKELEREKLIHIANEINKREENPEHFVICNGKISFTKNKTILNLHGKSITEITSIYGLDKIEGLTELDLSDNKIVKIEGLGKHINLTRLNLSKNEIKRITGLDKLINLESLDFSKNQITSIEGLDTLTRLEHLSLGDNLISKLEGLKSQKNLKSLDLRNNLEIEVLQGLERLLNLERLNLDNNKIIELKGLDTLVKLKHFSFNKNSPNLSIIEIKGLEHLIKLKEFKTTYYSSNGRIRRSKFGRLRKEFGIDGRQWVNYCREMVGLEKLKIIITEEKDPFGFLYKY